MTQPIRSAATWVSIAALALAASACQQASNTPAQTASSAASPAPASAPVSAPAAPAISAPAPPPPVTETGPVALASDATLPAPCQAYVRLVQACLDNQHGDPAADALAHFNNESLRTQLRSSRGSWASASDDHYRSRICDGHVAAFAAHQRTLGIAC